MDQIIEQIKAKKPEEKSIDEKHASYNLIEQNKIMDIEKVKTPEKSILTDEN